MSQRRPLCAFCTSPAVHICTTHATPVCVSLGCSSSCCPVEGAGALLTGPKTAKPKRPANREPTDWVRPYADRPGANITLNVERLGEKPLVIQINEQQTIRELKRLIGARLGLAPHEQRLTHRDDKLLDDIKVGEYELVDGDTLVLNNTIIGLLTPPHAAAVVAPSSSQMDNMLPVFQALARITAFQQKLAETPYEKLTFDIVSRLHNPPPQDPSSSAHTQLPDVYEQFMIAAEAMDMPEPDPPTRSDHCVRWLLEQFDPAISVAAEGAGSPTRSTHPWVSLFQWKKKTIAWYPGMNTSYMRESEPLFVTEPFRLVLPVYTAGHRISINKMLLKAECVALPASVDVGPSANAHPGYRVPARLESFFQEQTFIETTILNEAMDAITVNPFPANVDSRLFAPLMDILITLGGRSGDFGQGTMIGLAREVLRRLGRRDTTRAPAGDVFREVITNTVNRKIAFARCSVVVDPPQILLVTLNHVSETPGSTLPRGKMTVSVNLDELLVLPRDEVWQPEQPAAAADQPSYRLFAITGSGSNDPTTFAVDSDYMWYVTEGGSSAPVGAFFQNTVMISVWYDRPTVLWYAKRD